MTLVDEICAHAKTSTIRSYPWRDRGVAALGYFQGMAVAYAHAVTELAANTPAATVMTQPVGTPDRDVLAWYQPEITALGLGVATPSDRLRVLFALMLGLGMRESSGKYCEGRDTSANNVDGLTAEAGLFQMSYNSAASSPTLPPIIAKYAGRTDLADIFAVGVHCSPASWMN